MDSESYAKNYQVVLVCGGLGTRLRHRAANIPKALLEINGTTLLDHTINLYKANGFTDFVLLVGHLGDEIKKHVGDGKKYEITVRYSVEKELMGKGGALKFALENNAIDRKRPSIITYPDDIILSREFPKQLIRRHILGKEKGCSATVVRVNKTQNRYGVVYTDDEGFVIDFEEKPYIPQQPGNVGIYVLEPSVYRILDRMVDLKKLPVDFESRVVPALVRERLLYTFTIPFESWIPVNEEKEFQQAEKALKSL